MSALMFGARQKLEQLASHNIFTLVNLLQFLWLTVAWKSQINIGGLIQIIASLAHSGHKGYGNIQGWKTIFKIILHTWKWHHCLCSGWVRFKTLSATVGKRSCSGLRNLFGSLQPRLETSWLSCGFTFTNAEIQSHTAATGSLLACKSTTITSTPTDMKVRSYHVTWTWYDTECRNVNMVHRPMTHTSEGFSGLQKH